MVNRICLCWYWWIFSFESAMENRLYRKETSTQCIQKINFIFSETHMSQKTQKFLFLAFKILLIVAMIAVGAYFYAQLPDQIPTHWDAQWVINSYGSKLQMLVGLPLMSFALLLLFTFLPKRDPRTKNYENFFLARETMQTLILWFLTYIYCIIIYIVLHPEIAIMPLMLWGMGILFLIMWILMRHVKTNYFVWIRTPWTLENEEVRNKTHQLGGRTFAAAGVLLFISGFYTQYFLPIFIWVICLAALVPTIYSYVIYKQIKQ